MQEQELLQQFIRIGSTVTGGFAIAHWYYNMQVLHTVFLVLLFKKINYFTIQQSAEH